MRTQILFWLALLGVSACQDPVARDEAVNATSAVQQMALPELTLAELHRVDLGGGVDCNLKSNGSWKCFEKSQTGRVLTFQPAAEKAAPFAAQIYLHPEFTSEEYLLENGVKNRPMWALQHVCGATLIAPNWVVTAAHCFPDPKVDTSYGIRLGINNIANDIGYLYHVHEVVRKDPAGSPTRQNDIALVRFDPNETNANVVSQRDLADMAPDAPPIVAAEFQNGESLLSVIDGYQKYHAIDTEDWTVRASASFTSSLDYTPEANSLVTAVSDQGVSITPLNGQPPKLILHEGVSHVFLIDQDSVIISWSEKTGLIKATSLKASQTINQHQVLAGLKTVQRIEGSTLLFTQDKNDNVRILDLFNSDEQNIVLYERLASEDMRLQRTLAGHRIGLYYATNSDQLILIDMLTNVTIHQIDLFGLAYNVSQDATKIMLKYPGQIMVIDAMSGLGMASLPTFSTEAWSRIRLFENSQRALITNIDQKFVDIWDIPSVSRDARISFSNPHERIAVLDIFDEEGLVYIITNTPDFDAVRATQTAYIPSIKKSYVFSLSDGQLIAQLSNVRLAKLTPQATMEAQSAPSLIMFANGKQLLAWTASGRTNIWDLTTCPHPTETCPARVSIDHDVRIDDLTLTPDETKLLAITETGAVQVWETSSGNLIRTVFHGGTVEGAKVWGNGENLITYGTNGFVRFWDIASGQELRRLNFKPSSREGLNLPSQPDFIENTEPVFITPDASQDEGNEAENETVVTYIKLDETGDSLVDGAPVRAFGWGAKSIYVSGVRSEALREAGLQVLTYQTCQSDDYYGQRDDLHARTFCAHDIVRKTCVGDSGGPIIQGNTLAEAKLVGIVSWGSATCESDNKPGVYTRVASHAEWMKDVLGDDLPSN